MIRKVKTILLLCFLLSTSIINAQTVGTIYQSGFEEEGYTLFNPLSSFSTYLIDNCGQVVHEWTSSYKARLSVDYLENEILLRSCLVPNSYLSFAGKSGRIEALDWNSNVVWSYTLSDSLKVAHHDFEALPNGNVLVLAVEKKSPLEAYQAGRDTVNNLIDGFMYAEFLYEVQPIGIDSGYVVWEWHMWDHLVQEHNASVNNYGVVREHPELMDVNYVKGQAKADWMHANSVYYNQDLDQIALSFNITSEFMIIDHSTTTIESSSNTGGLMGKGGDLLYRYGNPQVYQHGDSTNQRNSGQHTVRWIPNGYKDAGKVMFFNNGKDWGYSSADIVEPLKDGLGNYILEADTTFGPDTAEWRYIAPNPTDLFSDAISGAQRLPNGNTLICEGKSSRFIEVDSLKNIVWEYISPMTPTGSFLSQGNVVTPSSLSSVFRATKYLPTYPGLVNKTLIPGAPLELNPDLSGCITNTTSLDIEKSTFIIYPNPTTGNVKLIFESSYFGRQLEVYNAIGQLLAVQIINSFDISIELQNKGMYFVKIDNELQKVVKY